MRDPHFDDILSTLADQRRREAAIIDELCLEMLASPIPCGVVVYQWSDWEPAGIGETEVWAFNQWARLSEAADPMRITYIQGKPPELRGEDDVWYGPEGL